VFRIAFASVGCKLNRYEVQVMSESLRPFGFITVPYSQDADCYVINTCSVTGDADLSSRQLIRRARRLNPTAKVIVTGCYAELRPEEIGELAVDAVVSNRDKEKLPEIVLKIFDIDRDTTDQTFSPLISGMQGMTRAFVKIQGGCDEQCAFCAIWMARGPVRSRPANQIIDELNKLAVNGYVEVALTGVHIGKYCDDNLDFVRLLYKLVDKTSIARIRLSSLNPKEVTEDLIALLKSNQRICPHIHLSIQSGDNGILKVMGRKYARDDIIAIINRLTEYIPNITIGADFIAGFPGETLEAFENTKSLIEKGRLHHLHIFPYSDRPGTRASTMAHKIPSAEKGRRTAILRDLGRIKIIRHLESFMGRELEVLFENRKRRDIMTGLSQNYLRVDAPFNKDCLGRIINVTPNDINGEHLVINANAQVSSGKKKLTLKENENKFVEPPKSG
jgi:threonylcarbamoyladenosine tRNA methylthiotransferase MtaB